MKKPIIYTCDVTQDFRAIEAKLNFKQFYRIMCYMFKLSKKLHYNSKVFVLKRKQYKFAQIHGTKGLIASNK